MKQNIFSLVILLLLFAPCPAQDAESVNKIDARLQAFPLVKAQRVCLDNSQMSFKNGSGSPTLPVRIDLELNVTYKNSGTYPVILDKGSGTVSAYKFYPKDFYSNPNALALNAHRDYMETGVSAKEGNEPSARFVILAQDESYAKTTHLKFRDDFSVLSADDEREYFIKMSLATISGKFGETNNANELRRKWSKIGYFWFEGVTAESLLIRFPDSKKLTMCQE